MTTGHNLILAATLALMTSMMATAEYTPGYYSRMEGKSKEALKAAAKECVAQHTMLGYYDLPTYWQFSDVYPELVDGCRRWWEMYSDEVYLIAQGQTAKSSFSKNRMQREHSVPKSWWKSGGSVEYTPCYSDMWNLYPSDGAANQAKSNYPLGEVDVPSFDNGVTRVGTPRTGTGGGSGFVFEPADQYKGDFARSFFYVATVYDNLPWVSYYNWMFTQAAYPTLKTWAYEMLLRWSRQDPVSQKEILRNDAVEKSQGNRNPFVDFPELAEYIWGTRTHEVFHIADQDGSQTPPITGPAEITLPVNNETLDFGQVAISGSGTSWLVIRGRNMTSPLSVRIGGTDKDAFTLSTSSIPASNINMTGEYMLTIMYTPRNTGIHNATLSLYDGGLSGSIRVNLKGEGCPRPTLTPLVASPATDINDRSYIAHWNAAPEVVDYYIVTRTRYTPADEETDDLEADTNSLLIEGRDPAVMETYSVRSSRLGYLSEASNTITVQASGINNLYDDSHTVIIAPVDEGFVVLAADGMTGSDNGSIIIYDTTGTVITTIDRPAHGDMVTLPSGMYIVAGSRVRTPRKIIVR